MAGSSVWLVCMDIPRGLWGSERRTLDAKLKVLNPCSYGV